MIRSNEFLQKKFYGSWFAAMSLILMTLLTTTTIVVSPASAKENPPVKIGNPHDFRPGPPIPSCAADFHQGPPNDPIKGCRDTP